MPSVVGTSRLDDVTALILATIRALPELEGVSVFDGPPVGDDSPKRLVLIGDDGDPESEVESTFEHTWANFSQTRKRETGEIPCAAIAWDGGSDVAPTRETAFLLMSVCELAILALVDDDLSISIVSGKNQPVQNSRGAATVVPFLIRYSTTL